MSVLSAIGDRVIEGWRVSVRLAAVACAVARLAFRPRNWPRTVRELLGRQVLFTGVEALGFVLFAALLAGISVVAQAQLWLGRFGQSEMLGSVLVAVIIRGIGPLLVNFIVIGRSATAVATELANMRVRREVDLLDAQGVDPTVYLVMPRVIGICVSVFCLTVLFVAAALLSGYAMGIALGITPEGPARFAHGVMGALAPRDLADFFAKTIIPGLLTGVICCFEGLTVRGVVTDVPQAATRGVVRSIAAVFVVSTLVSVLTYV